MQPTIKQYDADSFLQTLDTVFVGACTEKNALKIALAATVFFPEGGGQPADRGTIQCGAAQCTVLDVHEKDGIVWHTVDALPDAFCEGAAVHCVLDWAHRLDSMQQHSGEHILSGILHQLFGAENVGFHIGHDAVRMDTSCPISAQDLQRAETAANEIIWQNVPIVTTTPPPEALATLQYRSKKELSGTVRIVEIPHADVCACCGTHVKTSGQVGQIKILSAEHYKGGERLSVVCGARALRAAQDMRAREAEIGALLSAKSDQTAVAVQRFYADYNAVKLAKANLEHLLFAQIAAAAPVGEEAIVCLPDLSPDALHKLASALAAKTGARCAALTEDAGGDTPKTGYCIADASEGADVRALCKALNAACAGRGGGKPQICQGSAAASAAQLEDFLRTHH